MNRRRQRFAVAAPPIALAVVVLVLAFMSPSSTPAGDPDTAPGALAAAASELAAMHDGRYADAWHRLLPADQAVIPLTTWTQFYSQCSEHLAAYQVVTVASALPDTAIVVATIRYTGRGIPDMAGPVQMPLSYIGDQWRYDVNLTIWKQGTVSRMLTTARSYGIC